MCNFLTGAGGGQGNEIWWNGGDGTGVELGSHSGASYLTATHVVHERQRQARGRVRHLCHQRTGPGLLAHTYASNMADSAYYVGACADCNTTITDAHAEHSALGFSGTNAGGHLVIENSSGTTTSPASPPTSLNNDDAPPPQNGACPGTSTQVGPALSTGPTQHCTIIRNNIVDHNNDPNVPGSGHRGRRPGRHRDRALRHENILVTGNTVADNGAWGIVVHDYPDTETPPPVSHCQGGIGLGSLPPACSRRSATRSPPTTSATTGSSAIHQRRPGRSHGPTCSGQLLPRQSRQERAHRVAPDDSHPALHPVRHGQRRRCRAAHRSTRVRLRRIRPVPQPSIAELPPLHRSDVDPHPVRSTDDARSVPRAPGQPLVPPAFEVTGPPAPPSVD